MAPYMLADNTDHQSVSCEDGRSDFIRFDLPPLISQHNFPGQATKTDILLLTWLLVLYRYNEIDDVVRFSWGLRSTGDNHHLSKAILSTTDIPVNPESSALDLLEAVRSYREQIVTSDHVQSTKEILFFSNELSSDADLIAPESAIHSILVEIRIDCDGLWLRPLINSSAMTEFMALRHVYSIVDILNSMPAIWEGLKIFPLLELGSHDREELWRLNEKMPPAIEIPAHELVSKRVQTCPDAPAICSWDGDFTYAQVERYSTHLAHQLNALGLGVGQVVPLCFEKSRWTVIAVLAVMKAGATFVLMDPSQPLGRLQTIAQLVNAAFILTSKTQSSFGSAIVPAAKLVSVADDLFRNEAQLVQTPLAPVSPDSILYVIFTSGSTGVPKGVVISHTTYTSSVIPRSKGVGYHTTSRVLDFASYAFDVSIDSMLATLIQGGCLCIPSDEDRLNDLSGAIRSMKITMANLTPSVARILDDDIVPSLSSLGLGGESATAGDVELWGRKTRIVIGYGPSECTVGCTIQSNAAKGRKYTDIGTATGGVLWIVDRDDHNRLTPIGGVGELLVEGPIVGQGYLNEPKKTAEVFISDPTWLVEGGRHGRLYKTGDLVKYDPDGSGCLVFVGRKDSQVKLRGQRVELGEVEYHLKSQLPSRIRVAAEVIKPKNKQPALVAFISEGAQTTAEPITNVKWSTDVQNAIAEMDSNLSKVLPIYMIPAAYISLSMMPQLVSGKTDRKRLKELGSTLALQEQEKTDSVDRKAPVSSTEILLQGFWQSALGLKEDQIGKDSNFFGLGGDSILAMRLVAAARIEGFNFSVADVFSNPVLSDMAQVIQKDSDSAYTNTPAFSLLDPSIALDAICSEAAQLCGVDVSMVEDMYPCTPLQEILLAFSTRSIGSYTMQRIAEIPDVFSMAKLVMAWETASRNSPILRTRVIQSPKLGLMQVVVKGDIKWTQASNLQDYIAESSNMSMELGAPLTTYAIVTEASKTYFVWSIHHALYDGWSAPLILERVGRAYKGQSTNRPSEMKHFIKYLSDPAREASKDYWRNALSGAIGPQFPTLPSRTYLPKPDAIVEHFVPFKRNSDSNIMVATLVRGAWALVASQFTLTNDIVFGETSTGRSVPITGAEQLEGPMIATVPVRIRIDRTATVNEYLQNIQEEGFERMQHEHTGMQNIRRVSADAQLACEVKMGLVIQPKYEDEEVPEDGVPPFEKTDAAREALHFNSYPLMLVCSLRDEGFLISASFDSNLIDVPQMERVLAHFHSAVDQLTLDKNMQVGAIDCLTEEERAQIWKWNSRSPISYENPRQTRNIVIGEQYPNIIVPWIVKPMNFQQLTPIGAVGELVYEGPLASEDYVQDPTWLSFGSGSIPGRKGRVHRTGDLVKYNSDGTFLFLGRKESRFSVQGRAFDLLALETQIRYLLPGGTHFAAHLILPGNNEAEPILIAFLGENRGGEVELGVERVTPAGISTTISTELMGALLGLKKALGDLFPPHMIPTAYIPLDDFPLVCGETNRKSLADIASVIPRDLVSAFRSALSSLRTGSLKNSRVIKRKERTLLSVWSELLGTQDIESDDSFFLRGGDSIMAMKLVSAVRQAGFTLSVADVFRNMRFSNMLSVMGDLPSSTLHVSTHKPFSALKVADIESLISQEIRPALAEKNWVIKDLLPVTDTQARDIDATVAPPRSSVQYNMLFLEKSIDNKRLFKCCQQLVSTHDILRTVFVKAEGQYLAVILENLELNIEEHFTDEDIDAYSTQLSNSDVEEPFHLGSSFLKVIFVHGKEKNCLVLRLSHAQYDGTSLPQLIRQVDVLYRNEPIPSTPDFSSYIYQIMTNDTISSSISYWRTALADSTLSVLPCPTPEISGGRSVFTTKTIDLSKRSSEITMATLLTAAWSVVLARILQVRDVVFGGVVAGRSIDLFGVERIMGPCYTYVPIRVRFPTGITAAKLLCDVQEQNSSNSPYESLGFRSIAQNCTSWQADFFDSIVHHQNIEYFDSIPFADTQARVELSNPHDEPARPLKVVSYPEKDGRICYGIACEETQEQWFSDRLQELCDIVEGFVERPEEVLF